MVPKLRPADRIRPTKTFYPARGAHFKNICTHYEPQLDRIVSEIFVRHNSIQFLVRHNSISDNDLKWKPFSFETLTAIYRIFSVQEKGVFVLNRAPLFKKLSGGAGYSPIGQPIRK